MYQKDYILRLIEELAKSLAVIFGLMKKGDYKKASEYLSNTYYDLLKQEAAYFRQIPDEELTGKLLEKHNYTNGHLEILAGLFNAEAELCLARKDNEGSLKYSLKSLRLFRYVDKESRTYSQVRLDTIVRIEERIATLHDILPANS